MNKTIDRLIFSVIASATLIGASDPAAAGTVLQSGSNACDGVTAVDDSALQRNLSGILNNGSAISRVTCSVPVVADYEPPNHMHWIDRVDLDLINRSTATVTVQCRLQVQYNVSNPRTYSASSWWQAVTLAPGQPGMASFIIEQDRRYEHGAFAVGCALPGRTEIRVVKARSHDFEWMPIE